MAKEFTIQIKGSNWLVKKLSSRKFTKLHGDYAAMTLPTDKEIHFNDKSVLPLHIRHELLHAFISECNADNVKMDIDDMEELCCTIIGEHAIEIVKLADFIQTQFSIENL